MIALDRALECLHPFVIEHHRDAARRPGELDREACPIVDE